MKKVLLLILAIIVLPVAFIVLTNYNNIPKLDENVSEKWSQVQNQYKRRADLIPNLIETVKAYASHEKTTFIEVTEARNKVSQININENISNNPQALQQFVNAQDGLSSALSKLMVVVERYPELKANENFKALQSQLEGTENRITIARRDFIEAVKLYNLELRTIPGKFVAAVFHSEAKLKETFKASEAEQNAPKVQFMILNKTEKELISKEIEALEKASSVELVAVITQRSGDYKLASPMYSIFLVFCASLYFALFTDKSTFELVQIQLLIFIGFYLFFEYFKDFFFSILPKSYKYQIASTNANKQFYNLKLDQTKTKQAIMFFVSLDEKYVEIICDEKISKEIPDIHWRFIIDEFINDVKLNQLSSGYIKAINACSMILIEKFPIEKNDENELPNEVIEIKS